MDLEQFAFPFSVGMLAAFNPCGFAMLPTYIGYFIGTGEAEQPTRVRAISRGIWVGAMLTLGFVAVFGAIGILISLFLTQGDVVEYVGYVTVILGVLLIPMGIAMFMGRQIMVSIPKLNKGTDSRESSSMFLFGVSYAVVSLSCTIGLFISAVSNSFTTDGFSNGVGSFLAYSLGMGAIILLLTVSLARAKNNVAVNMRRILPYMGKISGVVLVIAGIYLIDYGVWELRIQNGNLQPWNLLVDHFETFQAAVSNWITDATPERIGVLAILVIAGLYLLAWFEDNPGDRTRQWSLTAVWVAFFAFLEINNDFDFVLAPIWRFVSNWPFRIANWFTDPWRGGVPLEILFIGLVAWWAYRKVNRYLPERAAVPAGTT
ncbi:MAG: cytochrome c biogenesis CcdA family protein [Actinomycetota bacterium]